MFFNQDSETKPSENDDDDDSVTSDHDNKRQQPGHHKHKDEVEKFLRFHSFKSVFQEEIMFHHLFWWEVSNGGALPVISNQRMILQLKHKHLSRKIKSNLDIK